MQECKLSNIVYWPSLTCSTKDLEYLDNLSTSRRDQDDMASAKTSVRNSCYTFGSKRNVCETDISLIKSSLKP